MTFFAYPNEGAPLAPPPRFKMYFVVLLAIFTSAIVLQYVEYTPHLREVLDVEHHEDRVPAFILLNVLVTVFIGFFFVIPLYAHLARPLIIRPRIPPFGDRWYHRWLYWLLIG